ncbi:hypothetical protein Q31b_17090 [Novipirellula aureliae]|uniref:Phytase-like domain-containing protein n=1 Tax=Novipirellula aureliae TaxID=2527966 RepID=A0A5C6E3D2_9BACT|nr:esterase-like activity of phytase family protein [Novipirellula aureliae]TWU44173.1 hypothetical protein Q31b_17090 [Novipirellula aureliae]
MTMKSVWMNSVWVFMLLVVPFARPALAAENRLVAAKTASKASSQPIELIGVLRLDGHIRDASGLDEKLEDGSYADFLGGLSAMEYTGTGDRFLLLADRGAGDGKVSYPCRFHEVDLTVDSSTKKITFNLVSTTMFSNLAGESVVGSLTAHQKDLRSKDGREKWTAMDPEGLRFLADGSLLVSDEYGPHLVIANRSGRIESEIQLPQRFRYMLPESGRSHTGIASNRGLEGVALTPSGNRVVAVPQSSLVQDGTIENGMCFGTHCRWLVMDSSDLSASNPVVKNTFEIDYPLEEPSLGVSEILAVDESRFLVLERDYHSGKLAKHKNIFLVDISNATDLSAVESMKAGELPEGTIPVAKQLFIDLLDPEFGLGGDLATEKPEGMCWGKPLADGRRTLWVCCDNDFDPSLASELYCFAVDL